jgi:hypothetical protein
MIQPPIQRARRKSPEVLLQAPGWTPPTRRALTDLIRRGSGKRLPVTLDFDNTIVCGDIGEATLAVLVMNGALVTKRIPPTLSPSFRLPGAPMITLSSAPDITSYYEAFLAPTVHGTSDPTPLANGYAWAVEIMEALTPLDVVQATEKAFAHATPRRQRMIEVTPGRTAFPAPFFYPEMVELLSELLRHQYDVWIVSASNVWSVRWMVARALNPLLLARGVATGIPADHVLGVSTLLQDGQGCLHKDALLVRENRDYARLEERTLGSFRLTSRLQFPVPTYSGKVGCLCDAVGCRPYLGVGDSPGDHAMLSFSEHRLWIARLEKPSYQQATLDLIRRTGTADWMVQPVLGRERPGFITDLDALPRTGKALRATILQSSGILSPQWFDRKGEQTKRG